MRECGRNRACLIGAAVLAAGVIASDAAAQPFAFERPAGGREIVAFFGDYIDQSPGDDFWRGSRAYRGSLGHAVLSDLDGDGEADDTAISQFFSMETELNMPEFLPPWPEFRYRVNEHGARFYGGLRVEYLNQDRFRIKQAFMHMEGANPHTELPDGRWCRWGQPEPAEARDGFTEITLFPYVPSEHGPGEPSRFESVWLWRQDGFREWAQGTNVRLGAHSRLSFTFARKWQNIQQARFVVGLGDGTFFISENWAEFGSEDLKGVDFIVAPTDLEWAAYSPAEGALDAMRFDEHEASFSSRTFEDVSSVGLYFSSGWSEVATRLAFDHFRVYAEVDGCEPADLAPPFGLYDLSDVLAFAEAMSTQDVTVDFDHNGVLDLIDIIEFVDQFTAGCPDG